MVRHGVAMNREQWEWHTCKRKRRYHSKRTAEEVAERVFAHTGDRVYVYPCTLCRGYHVGKKKQGACSSSQEG